MTQYISQEAQEIIDNPSEGTSVTLLLGVGGDEADAIEQLPNEARDTETVGFSTICTTVPETAVKTIEQLPIITAVEVEGTIETNI